MVGLTAVVHGYCPDCGKPTTGHPPGTPLGALCFSLKDVTRGARVIACRCGSRARPVPDPPRVLLERIAARVVDEQGDTLRRLAEDD